MGALSTFNLNSFINDYGCNIMIETGTGKGDSVRHALCYPFKKIYTIEIIKEIYDKATQDIKDPRTTFILGESLPELELLLKDIKTSDIVLFWLDAHFPGADFHIPGYSYDDDISKEIKLPLEMELNLIKKHRIGQDVIIIDDLNHYEDGPFEAGNLAERYLYFRDKYNLHGIDFIFNNFHETHNLKKNYQHQGYIILTPKRNNE
jgi:hypothetical protein